MSRLIFPSEFILLLPHPSQIHFQPSPHGRLNSMDIFLPLHSPSACLVSSFGVVQTMEDFARRSVDRRRERSGYLSHHLRSLPGHGFDSACISLWLSSCGWILSQGQLLLASGNTALSPCPLLKKKIILTFVKIILTLYSVI